MGGDTEPSACLDGDELVAMVEGGLAPDRLEAVLAHVDACPSCAEVIATLGRFEETPLVRGKLPPARPGGESGAIESRRVGRYVLDAPLGAGGMGIVYGAFDPELRRRVAIKIVRPEHADEASRARMLREARAAAQISHPNVVSVHDVGEHRGHVFVATELVDGETLDTWHEGRPPTEIVQAWIQAARGLVAAHARGVVHRDVKPSNVLVGKDGRVRIGDFGLARHEGDPSQPPRSPAELAAGSPSALGSSSVETATGAVTGTPAYMAPEQSAGMADQRSDQFSLCVGIVETLTGSRPRADATVDVAPPALAAALARGLRADPAARFPSVGALIAALERAIAPAPPRRWWVIGAAAAALAGLGGLALWIAASRGAAGPAPCEVAAVPADVWSPARRAAFASKGAPNVAPRIERWFATWSAASADVCATDRGDVTIRARRQRCLAGQLEAVRGQLLAIQSGSLSEPWALQHALDAFPRPAQCARAAVARTPEPTGDQAAQIQVLRARMERATSSDGDPAAATAAAREIVAEARGLAAPTFTVEMLVALAGVESDVEPAAALADLRSAVDVASAAGEPWTRLTAMLALLDSLGAADIDEATRLASAAHAAIVELGGDPVLDAEVEARLGAVHQQRKDDAAAEAAYGRAQRALRAGYQADSAAEALALAAISARLGEATAMFEGFGLRLPTNAAAAAQDPDALIQGSHLLWSMAHATGEDTPTLEFHTETNLANAYRLKREPETALRHFQRAAILGERIPELRGIALVEVYRRAAEILIELRRPREAVPKAQRARELAEPLALDASDVATLTTLGKALLEAGDASAHEPLERALAIRDRLKEPGTGRGFGRFLLARALPAAARARARELASLARADMQRAIDATPPPTAEQRDRYLDEIGAIDRWLDGHR